MKCQVNREVKCQVKCQVKVQVKASVLRQSEQFMQAILFALFLAQLTSILGSENPMWYACAGRSGISLPCLIHLLSMPAATNSSKGNYSIEPYSKPRTALQAKGYGPF